MGTVHFSMNGYRTGLTTAMDELRSAIDHVLEDVGVEAKAELIASFDEVACSVNSLNCVSLEGDPSFSDMTDSPSVRLLGDYDE